MVRYPIPLLLCLLIAFFLFILPTPAHAQCSACINGPAVIIGTVAPAPVITRSVITTRTYRVFQPARNILRARPARRAARIVALPVIRLVRARPWRRLGRALFCRR